MLMQLDPFRGELERLAEQLMSGTRPPRPFPMDAYRRGNEFVVSFDLPGVDPGTIDLTVEQNILTIKAERRFERREGDAVIVAERPHGAFSRQLFLGDTLDAERLEATYADGCGRVNWRTPPATSWARHGPPGRVLGTGSERNTLVRGGESDPPRPPGSGMGIQC